MRRFLLFFAVSTLYSLAVATPSIASKFPGGAGYTLVGTAALVSPGDSSNTAVEITSNVSGGSLTSGAIGFAPPAKLRQLDTLATSYEFLDGSSCWQGSPRFTVGVSNGSATKEIYFYIGPTNCPSGVWTNTGNLATSSSPVDDSQLPGGSFADPYSDVQARYGNYAIKYVAIDLDGGGGGSQTVELDNTQVNHSLYTYEP
jgi:hypothetical protein